MWYDCNGTTNKPTEKLAARCKIITSYICLLQDASSMLTINTCSFGLGMQNNSKANKKLNSREQNNSLIQAMQ